MLNNEYKTRVEMIANSLSVLRSADTIDRVSIIRHYEELALVMQSTASRLIANSVPTFRPIHVGDHLRNMIMYENHRIMRLLSTWGIEYYSTDEEPDFYDECLFNSVLQVASAVSLVMRPSYDLYGAAMYAIRVHSEHPQGAKVAAQWLEHYEHVLRFLRPVGGNSGSS